MSTSVVVLGTGGHAKVVIATARSAGLTIAAAYDDNEQRHGETLLGVPIIGSMEEAEDSGSQAIIAIGSNRIRETIASRVSCEWTSLVHPSASVHSTACLGPGTVVFAGVVVQPDVIVGSHGILNTASSVDHDCVLGDAVHIGPGAHLCGGVCIGDGSLAGVGSSFIPGVQIGSWCSVGAGAAVIQDFSSGQTIVGVPANSRLPRS